MRVKMFGYLTIFTMIVLVVIWLLQAVFLNDIYRQTKAQEIKIATRKVAAAADKTSFEKSVYDIASRYNTCVSVYQISGSSGTLLVEAHTQTNCMIHSSLMTDTTLNTVYAEALKEKMYTSIYQLDDIHTNFESMLCAKLVDSDSEKDSLLIILNAEIQPVSATVSTLRFQLIMITGILLVV